MVLIYTLYMNWINRKMFWAIHCLTDCYLNMKYIYIYISQCKYNFIFWFRWTLGLFDFKFVYVDLCGVISSFRYEPYAMTIGNPHDSKLPMWLASETLTRLRVNRECSWRVKLAEYWTWDFGNSNIQCLKSKIRCRKLPKHSNKAVDIFVWDTWHIR